MNLEKRKEFEEKWKSLSDNILPDEYSAEFRNQLWQWIEQQLIDEIEECAKIAEAYEPDEKQIYIDYVSSEIRKLRISKKFTLTGV